MAFNIPPTNMPGKPEPFTLHVPEKELSEFYELLKLSKIGPATWWNQHTDGRFGVSREWLSQAKETWLTTFDWRQHEDRINKFPNFKMTVDDAESGKIDIHFLALFSSNQDAVPFVFLHGFPSSFLELLPMMELLSEKYTPETLPYHIIVPSLPDYGLSGSPSENVEMTLDRAARIMHQLMMDLGFSDGYVAQGGDLGSMLARIMSVKYDECKAFHRLRIGEKLLEWPDQREPLSLDTILAMVSLYWFTDTFPRSLYHAQVIQTMLKGETLPISKEKPLGYSMFPRDVALLPKAWAHQLYPNLVFFKAHEVGGHFARLEQPKLFLQDIEEFAQRVRESFIHA
ncbi:hypothetical protein ACSS6W_001881 [Trichoderma asperelloides]